MKRRLGIDYAEWDALPWYVQDTYIEGLVAEYSDESQDEEVGELPGLNVEQVN